MKYLYQITIIASISLVGELLHHIIPLSIPSSIYGLLLLFFLLLTGVLKVAQIKAVGDFLLSLMPIMFVAPTVGLIESFDDCREFIIPILLAATVGTLIVMAVTGLVSQSFIALHNKKEDSTNDK